MNTLFQTLKPYQRNILSSALVLIAIVVILAFLFGIFWSLRIFVGTFSMVLWPLAVAGIAAMMLRPLIFQMQRTLRCNRQVSISIAFLFLLALTAGILIWGLPLLFEQTALFIKRLPTLSSNIRDAFILQMPAVEHLLSNTIGVERLEAIKAAGMEKLELGLGQIPSATQELFSRLGTFISIGTGLAMIPIYLFFFLQSDRDFSQDLDQQLTFLKSEWREDIMFLIRQFVGSIEAFFRGQLLIGLIIGIMLSIAFSFIGINFGIGLGLVIGALNIVPYLGTIIGLGLVLPIAYFQPEGGLVPMLLALTAFGFVQAIEGYILTPHIMGKRTGLHPLTIIIAIFFWGVALDGLLGMVLAIPLTAFFVVAWRLAKRKYLRLLSGVAQEPDLEATSNLEAN